MKIAKQILKLVEDEQPKKLSDDELKKFWKDMQEHVFKESKEVKKHDMGLFYDGTEISFDTVPVDRDGEITNDFERKPKEYVNDLSLKALSPKDIVSVVLNEYTLDRESTEEEDQQALDYLIKNLKGEVVYVYGEGELPTSRQDGSSGEFEIKFDAKVKINRVDYNKNEDVIEVKDYDIISVDVNF